MVDSVGVFLNVVQSGLVVSGNGYMTCTRVVNSGDALTSFRVSGPNDFIGLRLSPGRTNVLTGGYTEVADVIVCDIYHHDTSFATSGVVQSGASVAAVQRMTNDMKTTVASGVWTGYGISPPKLIGETHPLAQSMFSRATLTYRTRYLNP